MHRTQIMLEQEDYEAIREEASRTGRSMGQVVRDYVKTGLRGKARRERAAAPGLKDIKGLFSDRECAGRNHDDVLYGGR